MIQKETKIFYHIIADVLNIKHTLFLKRNKVNGF